MKVPVNSLFDDSIHTELWDVISNYNIGQTYYNRSLNLAFSSITRLPIDLYVDGFVSLRHTKIRKLPSNLKINGYLDITNTLIKEIPPDICVYGPIYTNNGVFVPDTALHHGVQVEG